MGEQVNVFEKLYAIDVGDHTDKKNNLTYLSWAWAWAEFKKQYPDATYEIWRDDQGRPYISDPDLGYMVFTSVTVGDLTHSMWLPVMDNKNNAMKNVEYSYKKYGTHEETVQPATMFNVNTAIMRCLTKNLAMFGLGLYIYAGEDIPNDDSEAKPEQTDVKTSEPSNSKGSTIQKKSERDILVDTITEHARTRGLSPTDVGNKYHINKSTPIGRLKEVLADIDKDAEPKQQKFEAIDEPVPWEA